MEWIKLSLCKAKGRNKEEGGEQTEGEGKRWKCDCLLTSMKLYYANASNLFPINKNDKNSLKEIFEQIYNMLGDFSTISKFLICKIMKIKFE